MKKSIYIVVLYFLLILAGCGNANVDKTDTQEDEADLIKEEEIKKAQRDAQTLWGVLDEQGNEIEMLPDDHTDVQSIMTSVINHVKVTNNRDHKTINAEAEYPFYMDEFAEGLKNSDYGTALQEMYEKNELSTEQVEIVWYKSYFNENISTCKVTIDCEFIFTGAKPEYLEEMGLKLDTVYMEQRVYYCQKIDKEWKITNIEKGALEEKGTM